MVIDEFVRKRLFEKTIQVGECLEWTGSTVNGYGRMKVDGKFVLAHRLSRAIVDGCFPEDGMDVCHTCDNRKCVNPKHLFVGTRSDNMRDCAAKKRLASQNGVHAPRHLNESHIEQISDMLKTMSQRRVAKALGVSHGAVWFFVKRYL